MDALFQDRLATDLDGNISLTLTSVESSVEFYTGGCEGRTWAREAKKFSLLEAVARVRLMKK
jgi:hypothetical protein